MSFDNIFFRTDVLISRVSNKRVFSHFVVTENNIFNELYLAWISMASKKESKNLFSFTDQRVWRQKQQNVRLKETLILELLFAFEMSEYRLVISQYWIGVEVEPCPYAS